MSEVYARTTGTTTKEYTDPVISPLPITVDGSSVATLEVFEGATMSNSSSKAVNNTGGTVTITGATITGNSSDNGGAVADTGTGILTVSNTVFDGNSALYRGGAVYGYGTDVSVTLTNVNFFRNILTTDRGSITNPDRSLYGGAVALQLGGRMTVAGGTFANNVSTYWGGAAAVRGGTLNFSGTTFTGNTALYGGAIYVDPYYSGSGRTSILTLTNVVLSGNTASAGGAIYAQKRSNGTVTVEIVGATFTGNTASGNGGAIYSQDTMTIRNTTFSTRIDTIYNTGSMTWSGKITLAGDVTSTARITVSDGTEISLLISDRTVDDGVILSTNNLTLGENVSWSVGMAANQTAGDYKLVGGTVGSIAGASVYDVAESETSVSVTVNAAPERLGNKYVWLHTDASSNLCLQVLDNLYAVTMKDGTAKTFYTDAVISSEIAVNGTTVDALKVFTGATMSNASGKAVNNTGGTVTITGATVTGNSSENGGAITNTGVLSVSDTVFDGNSALYRGGAIFNDGYNSAAASVTLTNVSFFRNKLTSPTTISSPGNTIYGGALSVRFGGTVTAVGGTFANNVSTYYGGAASVREGSLNFSGTTFTGNTALYGGAIYVDPYYTGSGRISTLTLTNVVLSGNTASAGGAIYAQKRNNGTVTVEIVGATFTGNTASGNGGAIYSQDAMTISNTTFATRSDTIYNTGSMTWSGKITLAGDVTSTARITVSDGTEISLLISDRTVGDGVILSTNDLTLGENISWSVGIAANQTAGDYKLVGGTVGSIATVSVYDVAAPGTSVSVTVNAAPQLLEGRYVWLHTDSDSNLCLQVADAIYGKSYLGETLKNLYANAEMAPVTLDGTTLDRLEVFTGAHFSGTSKAVSSTGSTVTITGALFSDIDTTEYGGAAITNINGSLAVSDTTIARTVSASRGAIMNRTGSATPATAVMNNVIFLDNKATASGSLGGAIFNYATAAGYTASYTQTGGYFSGNTASSGGAIYNDGIMSLTGVTFSGNFASGNGGAINNARTLTLTNTTFTTANDSIHNSGTLNVAGTLDLNSDLSGSGIINADTATITVTGTLNASVLTVNGANTLTAGTMNLGALTINAGASVNFTVAQDLSAVALTVDGASYAGSPVTVATGVTAIGNDWSVTGASGDSRVLVLDNGNLVLTSGAHVPTDEPVETFVGSTLNFMTGGTITKAFFGMENPDDGTSIVTTVTGGTVGNALIAGAKVTKGHTAGLDTVTLNLSGDACIKGGTANGGMLYTAGYAYGKNSTPTGTDSEVTLSVTTATLNLADGFAPVENLYTGAHARQGALTRVASTAINVTGGTYGRVYGGGWGENYGRSEVGSSTITVTGGTLGYIYAGGGNAKNGESAVTGNVTISVSGSAQVGIVFLAGKNQNCSITGNVTMTVSGPDKSITRISGWNANGDKNTAGLTTLNVETNLSLQYLDNVKVIRIAEGKTMDVSTHLWHEAAAALTIDFDLATDNVLSNTDWIAMSGDGMEVYQAAQYTIDNGAICRWNSANNKLIYEATGEESGYALEFFTEGNVDKVRFFKA